MREKLSNSSEMGLWKGPNISVAEHIIIPSRTDYPVDVPVLVTPDSFPPKKNWNLGKVVPLKVSVRSRFAQPGLDIDDEMGNMLLNDNGSRDEPHKTVVKVTNRCMRPIEILSGTGLFRLYAERDSALKGYSLERMLLDEKIKIAGKKGVDWEWAFDADGKTQIGIYIKINPNNRRWIPPHPINEPLIIDDRAEDYRGILDAFLESVPLGSKEKLLWIGETARLSLRGVNGILDKVTHTHLNPDDSNGFGTQINSRLIDEKSDWAVRVEILSETTWRKMSNFVRMRFVKSG